ncbi:MAG: tetratricopeptide repeat protein, partial [Candidatus Latescibacterota bacterium]
MKDNLIHLLYIGIFLSFSLPAICEVSAQASDTEEYMDYRYAVTLYTERMYGMAVKEFARFIDAYPSSSDYLSAQYYLAGSYFYLKQFPKTIEITQFVLKEHPSLPNLDKILFLEGKAHFSLGEYREAIAVFEQMLKGFAASDLAPEALYTIGESQYALKEYKAAADACLKAATGYPASAVADWAWYR